MTLFGCFGSKAVQHASMFSKNQLLIFVHSTQAAVFTVISENCEGTGILVSPKLILTSHSLLPTVDIALKAKILVSGNGEKKQRRRNVTIVPDASTTKSFRPHEFFLTNKELGLTIVSCEGMSPDVTSIELFNSCENENVLEIGQRVLLLGHLDTDGKKYTTQFAWSRINGVGEKHLTFLTKYKRTSNKWASGTAGFDSLGNLKLVVCQPPGSAGRNVSISSGTNGIDQQVGVRIEAILLWLKENGVRDFNHLPTNDLPEEIKTANNSSSYEMPVEPNIHFRIQGTEATPSPTSLPTPLPELTATDVPFEVGKESQGISLAILEGGGRLYSTSLSQRGEPSSPREVVINKDFLSKKVSSTGDTIIAETERSEGNIQKAEEESTIQVREVNESQTEKTGENNVLDIQEGQIALPHLENSDIDKTDQSMRVKTANKLGLTASLEPNEVTKRIEGYGNMSHLPRQSGQITQKSSKEPKSGVLLPIFFPMHLKPSPIITGSGQSDKSSRVKETNSQVKKTNSQVKETTQSVTAAICNAEDSHSKTEKSLANEEILSDSSLQTTIPELKGSSTFSTIVSNSEAGDSESNSSSYLLRDPLAKQNSDSPLTSTPSSGLVSEKESNGNFIFSTIVLNSEAVNPLEKKANDSPKTSIHSTKPSIKLVIENHVTEDQESPNTSPLSAETVQGENSETQQIEQTLDSQELKKRIEGYGNVSRSPKPRFERPGRLRSFQDATPPTGGSNASSSRPGGLLRLVSTPYNAVVDIGLDLGEAVLDIGASVVHTGTVVVQTGVSAIGLGPRKPEVDEHGVPLQQIRAIEQKKKEQKEGERRNDAYKSASKSLFTIEPRLNGGAITTLENDEEEKTFEKDDHKSSVVCEDNDIVTEKKSEDSQAENFIFKGLEETGQITTHEKNGDFCSGDKDETRNISVNVTSGQDDHLQFEEKNVVYICSNITSPETKPPNKSDEELSKIEPVEIKKNIGTPLPFKRRNEEEFGIEEFNDFSENKDHKTTGETPSRTSSNTSVFSLSSNFIFTTEPDDDEDLQIDDWEDDSQTFQQEEKDVWKNSPIESNNFGYLGPFDESTNQGHSLNKEMAFIESSQVKENHEPVERRRRVTFKENYENEGNEKIPGSSTDLTELQTVLQDQKKPIPGRQAKPHQMDFENLTKSFDGLIRATDTLGRMVQDQSRGGSVSPMGKSKTALKSNKYGQLTIGSSSARSWQEIPESNNQFVRNSGTPTLEQEAEWLWLEATNISGLKNGKKIKEGDDTNEIANKISQTRPKKNNQKQTLVHTLQLSPKQSPRGIF